MRLCVSNVPAWVHLTREKDGLTFVMVCNVPLALQPAIHLPTCLHVLAARQVYGVGDGI